MLAPLEGDRAHKKLLCLNKRDNVKIKGIMLK